MDLPLRSSDDPQLPTLVAALAMRLAQRRQTLATAESCTGGAIAATCTGLAGSSVWFDRGFVTYSNAAKTDLLCVSADLIAAHGAVSEPVARQMAEGARRAAGTDWSVAVTGVAGPGGGTPDKPVGTVWLAWCGPHGTVARGYRFDGDRAAVRQASVKTAIQGLIEALDAAPH